MVKMRAYSQDLRDRVIDLHKTSKYRIKAISTLLTRLSSFLRADDFIFTES